MNFKMITQRPYSRVLVMTRSLLLTTLLVQGFVFAAPQGVSPKPNIIVVLADDLGYGDARCYDPEFAKVPTPNIDRLAQQGMRFLNAHDSASLCSPSRYSLLTGRACWRSPLREHVVRHYGSPLIAEDRLTLPKLLQQEGYKTACFGKWHLGWDWALKQKDGTVAYAPSGKWCWSRQGEPVFDKPIKGGPVTRGFDTYFGVDVPNFPPYTFIENDRMLQEPSEAGTRAPGWQFDKILPTLVEKTEAYIAERAKEKRPFFIYMALTSPHEPIAPSKPFRGKSGISPIADFIMETDAALGSVMTALEKGGISDNTLLIFTSDNGHCAYTGLLPFVKAGHRVSGPYRGYKGNISEGGHRIPLVIRWPAIIKAGVTSEHLVCLSDLMATCAELLKVNVPANAAEDSVSFLPLLYGKESPSRKDLVVQCYHANVLAILEGPWKLALCAGDGCKSPVCNEKGVPHDLGENEAKKQGLPGVQLYNLRDDPGETKNLQAEHPEIVKRLYDKMSAYVSEGRSTQGPKQANDVKITLPLNNSSQSNH